MVKFEELMQKHNLQLEELPEKIQSKIENFDEVYEVYNEAEEDSKEERDAELKLSSLDDGICNDLESYISSKQKEQGGQSEDEKQASNNTAPQQSESSNNASDSFIFWM